jgi:hypothetical protein
VTCRYGIARRIVLALLGVSIAAIGLAVGLFSLTLFLDPQPKRPLLQHAIGVVIVLVCAWVLSLAWRLLTDRPHRGGLMGPTALRISGVLFLIMPIGGLLDGYYLRWGSVAIAQGIASMSTGLGLFVLAERRSRKPR